MAHRDPQREIGAQRKAQKINRQIAGLLRDRVYRVERLINQRPMKKALIEVVGLAMVP